MAGEEKKKEKRQDKKYWGGGGGWLVPCQQKKSLHQQSFQHAISRVQKISRDLNFTFQKFGEAKSNIPYIPGSQGKIYPKKDVLYSDHVFRRKSVLKDLSSVKYELRGS